MFEVEIKDLSGSFQCRLKASNFERETLLSLLNPNDEAVLKQHQHLQNISMNGMDKKIELLVHLIFGVSNSTKIKVQEMSRVG